MVRDLSPLICRVRPSLRLAALAIATASVLGGCNPSELKDWFEGNRDIPDEWTELVPERAEEGLIDAKIEPDYDGGGLSLKYHDGEWTDVVNAFRSHLEGLGYVELATCTLADAEAGADEVASAVLVKPTDSGADVVMPGLGILIKFNDHFFVKVQRHDLRRLNKPATCTFNDKFATYCEAGSDDVCTFKSAS